MSRYGEHISQAAFFFIYGIIFWIEPGLIQPVSGEAALQSR